MEEVAISSSIAAEGIDFSLLSLFLRALLQETARLRRFYFQLFRMILLLCASTFFIVRCVRHSAQSARQ